MSAGWPTHSNEKSTPFGQISLTASIASTCDGVDEVGGPELLGQRFLLRVGVDRDDRQRVGQRGTLDDVEADAADADHRDALAVGDLGPVEHGADAGDDATAEQRGDLEGHVLVDRHGLAGLHDGLLGERADVGELEHLAIALAERRRHLADRLAAVRGLAALARRARTAVAERRDHHVVADLHAR